MSNVHSQFVPEVELDLHDHTLPNGKPNGVMQPVKENHDPHTDHHKHPGHISTLDSANRVNKSLSGLFDTPTRDRRDSSYGLFGETSPRHNDDLDEVLSEGGANYNVTKNQNLREYLDNNYDKDKKSLFGFFSSLKTNEKPENKLWGDFKETIVVNKRPIEITNSHQPISFNAKRTSQSIYRYDIDTGESSELALLHKRSRHSEQKFSKHSVDTSYYNPNLLDASWNDFFLRPAPRQSVTKKLFSSSNRFE